MRRIVVLTLLLLLPFAMGVGFKKKGPRSSGGLPGLDSSGIGNESTLNYLLDLQYFHHVPQSDTRTHYYVSADNGGRAAAGSDSNDGLTWATAFRSIRRIDDLIESTCHIAIWMDTDGGNDDWRGQLNNDSGVWWDGGIGPPPLGCGNIESPAVVILNSDKAHPWKMDVRDMDFDQQLENCSGANYGSNACDNNDDTLFHGSNNDSVTGWLATEAYELDHYPRHPENDSRDIKDITGGNFVGVGEDQGVITGGYGQVNSTSNHGGADIHINGPIVRLRPSTDYDEACGASNDSDLLCVDDDPVMGTGAGGTLTACTAAGVPYKCCEQNNSKCRAGNNPLFLPANGGTIIISDKDYRYESVFTNTDEEYKTLVRALNGTFLILLGNMSFYQDTHPRSSRLFAARSDDEIRGISFEASGADQSVKAGPWIIAFVNFIDRWGAFGYPLIDIDNDVFFPTTGTGRYYNLKTWGIRVAETEYATIGTPTLPGSVKTNQDTIEFECSEIVEFVDALGYGAGPVLEFRGNNDSTPNDSLDIHISDLTTSNDSLLHDLGYDYTTNTDITTVADLRSRLGSYNAVACDGDRTCAAAATNVSNDNYYNRLAATAPSPRPQCSGGIEFYFPDTARGDLYDAWIPAYVAGTSIKGFRFGRNP